MSETSNVPAPTRASATRLRDCKTVQQALQSDEMRDLINAAVPKHLNGDRMLRTFIQATGKQPLLLECDMRGVIGQMLTCTALGVEINTPLGHAYLIPFKNRRKVDNAWTEVYEAQLVLGYKGLVDLAFRSGQITDVDADVVCRGDQFDWEKGSHKRLRYRQIVPKAVGIPTHAFATAGTKIGGAPFDVMLWDDVLAIRNGSKGYQAAVYMKDEAEKKGWAPPKGWTEAPWVKHEKAMGAKTVFKQLANWLPLSPELAAAIALDNGGEHGRVGYGAIIEGRAEPGDFLNTAIDNVDLDVGDGDTTFTDRRPDREATTRQEEKKEADAPKEVKAARDRAANKDKPAGQKPPATTKPPAETKPPAQEDPPPASEEDYGQQRTKPPASTASKPAQPEPVQSTPPQDKVPQTAAATTGEALDLYLADEHGEMVEGDEGFTQDPVVFARRFIVMWTKSKNREALCEQNADALQDARNASDAAVDILDEIHRTPDEAEPPQPPPEDEVPATTTSGQTDPHRWHVNVPVGENGRPNLPAFVSAVRLSLASVTSAGVMLDWIEMNGATYARMPKATQTAVEAAISARKADIGMIDNPMLPANQQPGAAGAGTTESRPAPRDADRERTNDRLADVADCKTRAEINALIRMTAIKVFLDRMRTERPELFAEVKAATDARWDALEGTPES